MSAETDAVVAKLANVGQARAALVTCIEKLRKGMDLVDQTGAIDIAAGVADAALSSLSNIVDFCVRIEAGLSPDDSAGLSELDRRKLKLAFTQTEETVKLVADLSRSPGFAAEFSESLNLVLTTVLDKVAQAAASVALPLWPLWLTLGLGVAGFLWLRRTVLA